jgi:hypothetical protein
VSGNRVIGKGFLATAGTLLVATSAVLVAAGVKDWRWLTAATVVVPVATLFAGIWQERFKTAVKARDTLAENLAKGALTPGGRLPRVREIIDPITVGVHPAPRRESAGHDTSNAAQSVGGADRVPVYVPRDIDAELRHALSGGGFVLLVGDSTAGKTRAAFEAMRAVLPDHVLIVPYN